MVPNSIPTVHVLSAHPPMISSTRSGTASVVRSRSPGAAAEEHVPHRPADERQLVPGPGEQLAELRRGRGVRTCSSAAAALRWSALKVAFWATEVESDTGIEGS